TACSRPPAARSAPRERRRNPAARTLHAPPQRSVCSGITQLRFQGAFSSTERLIKHNLLPPERQIGRNAGQPLAQKFDDQPVYLVGRLFLHGVPRSLNREEG